LQQKLIEDTNMLHKHARHNFKLVTLVQRGYHLLNTHLTWGALLNSFYTVSSPDPSSVGAYTASNKALCGRVWLHETRWMKLHPPMFLTNENMEQIEDILRGMCPTTLKLPSLLNLRNCYGMHVVRISYFMLA